MCLNQDLGISQAIYQSIAREIVVMCSICGDVCSTPVVVIE